MYDVGIRGQEHAIVLTEPITPELVLVDPELALHARAQLPDAVPQSPAVVAPAAARLPEQGRLDSTPSVVGAGDILSPDRFATDARSRQTAISPPSARKAVAGARRSYRFLPARMTARSLALVLAAAAAALVLASSRHDGPRLLSADVGPTGDEAARPAPRKPAEFREPKTQSGRGDATTAKPVRRPRVATAPQTFVWLPVEGTTHYRVDFYRSGRRVLRAFPSRARLVVPGSWQYRGRTYELRAGRYVWIVRPGFGPRSSPRYGQPIVRSSWTFTG